MEKSYYKHKIENLLVIHKIVTIHYFEFDKHFSAPIEAHDFWELVYADQESIICHADGREILLNEGELLFHKPNEQHTLRANGISAPNVFIISFDCKSEAVKFFENKKFRLPKPYLHLIYSIIEESKKTFNLPYSDPLLKKMQLLPTPTLGGQQLIKNYLELLLIQLMRSETEKADSNAVFLPQAQFIERLAEQVKTFLSEKRYERVNVADVCSAVHYNKSYVFKQFKRATGISVMAYFTDLKIQTAKRLLRESDLSIAQISEKLAFDTPNYFSKTFKKLTGITPLQYRKAVTT